MKDTLEKLKCQYDYEPAIKKRNLALVKAGTNWGSTLAVASSRMRTWFLCKMARARQTSWRWPTLKLLPPSASLHCKPPAKSWTASFSSTWRQIAMWMEIAWMLHDIIAIQLFLKLNTVWISIWIRKLN